MKISDEIVQQDADKLEELAALVENGHRAVADLNEALAEKDKEIAALKYQNEVRQDLINELRNAGGTDG